jgi:hypothetical protein
MTVLPAVPGASLTITGLYPHARYISFTTYDPALRAVDGVNDQRIEPDVGSTNVFLPGADRTVGALQRRYTVTVVFGQRPKVAPDNTVYTTSADGSHSAANFLVVFRVYRVDNGLDIDGGAGIPTVRYNPPGGRSVGLPSCRYPEPPPNGLNQQIANSGSGSSTPVVAYPGTNPPAWHKFFNTPTSLAQGAMDNGCTGTNLGDGLLSFTTQLPSGGFLQNLDNSYIFTQLSHGYGNIAVVHGRLPTIPKTHDGEPTMATGQLRYWSLWSNDSPSERFYGCLADDQIATDPNGYYTVVVSTEAARPSAATLACGVNWLPWGPSGSSLLIMRNMLPDQGFSQAIQRAQIGTEQQTMGAYYPTTTYMSTAQFQAGNCSSA